MQQHNAENFPCKLWDAGLGFGKAEMASGSVGIKGNLEMSLVPKGLGSGSVGQQGAGAPGEGCEDVGFL